MEDAATVERRCWSTSAPADATSEALFSRLLTSPLSPSALAAATAVCMTRSAARDNVLAMRLDAACAAVFEPRQAWEAREGAGAARLLAAALRGWSAMAAVLGVSAGDFVQRLPSLVAHVDHCDVAVRSAALAGVALLFEARFERAESIKARGGVVGCPRRSNLGVVLSALASGTESFAPVLREKRRARVAQTALCGAVWATAASGTPAPGASVLYCAASGDGTPKRVLGLSGTPFAGDEISWRSVILFDILMRTIGVDGVQLDLTHNPVAMRVCTAIATATARRRNGDVGAASLPASSGGLGAAASSGSRTPNSRVTRDVEKAAAAEEDERDAKAAAVVARAEQKRTGKLARAQQEADEHSELEAKNRRGGKSSRRSTSSSLSRALGGGLGGAFGGSSRRGGSPSSPQTPRRLRSRSIDSPAAHAFDDGWANEDSGASMHDASGLDNVLAAVSAIGLGGASASDAHPERRLKAAFAAYSEVNEARLRAERPELRLSQIREIVLTEWKKRSIFE